MTENAKRSSQPSGEKPTADTPSALEREAGRVDDMMEPGSDQKASGHRSGGGGEKATADQAKSDGKAN